MSVGLRPAIDQFIQELAKTFPPIMEIWWIGSRANCMNVRPDSDWDFLVFTRELIIPKMRNERAIKKECKTLLIDLLVENEPGVFRNVWGKQKALRIIEDLKWKSISETEAVYYGTKLIEQVSIELNFQSEWEKYFSEHGADTTSKDVSAWMRAKKIWPNR